MNFRSAIQLHRSTVHIPDGFGINSEAAIELCKGLSIEQINTVDNLSLNDFILELMFYAVNYGFFNRHTGQRPTWICGGILLRGSEAFYRNLTELYQHFDGISFVESMAQNLTVNDFAPTVLVGLTDPEERVDKLKKIMFMAIHHQEELEHCLKSGDLRGLLRTVSKWNVCNDPFHKRLQFLAITVYQRSSLVRLLNKEFLEDVTLLCDYRLPELLIDNDVIIVPTEIKHRLTEDKPVFSVQNPIVSYIRCLTLDFGFFAEQALGINQVELDKAMWKASRSLADRKVELLVDGDWF